MPESWPTQLPEDLELIRQKISDLPVGKRSDLYAALQYDENEGIKTPETHAKIDKEMLRYTKEMWPLMCGVTRSNKVWFVGQWSHIPISLFDQHWPDNHCLLNSDKLYSQVKARNLLHYQYSSQKILPSLPDNIFVLF